MVNGCAESLLDQITGEKKSPALEFLKGENTRISAHDLMFLRLCKKIEEICQDFTFDTTRWEVYHYLYEKLLDYKPSTSGFSSREFLEDQSVAIILSNNAKEQQKILGGIKN